MTEDEKPDNEVDQFIVNEIDSVPHLEALLLIWNSRPKAWSREELAKRLYVGVPVAQGLLQDLVRQGLLAVGEGAAANYSYPAGNEERDRLIARIDAIYRREVVRISTLIHSKPSSSLRDFAQAFRFTKERE